MQNDNGHTADGVVYDVDSRELAERLSCGLATDLDGHDSLHWWQAPVLLIRVEERTAVDIVVADVRIGPVAARVSGVAAQYLPTRKRRLEVSERDDLGRQHYQLPADQIAHERLASDDQRVGRRGQAGARAHQRPAER